MFYLARPTCPRHQEIGRRCSPTISTLPAISISPPTSTPALRKHFTVSNSNRWKAYLVLHRKRCHKRNEVDRVALRLYLPAERAHGTLLATVAANDSDVLALRWASEWPQRSHCHHPLAEPHVFNRVAYFPIRSANCPSSPAFKSDTRA